MGGRIHTHQFVRRYVPSFAASGLKLQASMADERLSAMKVETAKLEGRIEKDKQDKVECKRLEAKITQLLNKVHK